MATWVETQQGLLNADYVIEVGLPYMKDGEWRIDITRGFGEVRVQRFQDKGLAEKAFRHYVGILTSNCG